MNPEPERPNPKPQTPDPKPDRFAHDAMATAFQILVAGQSREYAQQAADAAFAEVDEIERAISKFQDSSDVAQINHAAPGQWITVTSHTIACLKAAEQVCADTHGAFDVTIGPLMAIWRNPDKTPRQPSDQEIADARAHIGIHRIERDEALLRVRTNAPGVRVDLGGIGKGYAVARAAEVLKEWDVTAALISGGDSSVYAMGNLPGEDGWPVGVGGLSDEKEPPYKIRLRNNSLSGSGTHVKGSHIMDPRSGRPVTGRLATWALHPSATVADALSTAFMVMSSDEVEQYCRAHAEASAMLVLEAPGEPKHLSFGKWKLIPTPS